MTSTRRLVRLVAIVAAGLLGVAVDIGIVQERPITTVSWPRAVATGVGFSLLSLPVVRLLDPRSDRERDLQPLHPRGEAAFPGALLGALSLGLLGLVFSAYLFTLPPADRALNGAAQWCLIGGSAALTLVVVSAGEWWRRRRPRPNSPGTGVEIGRSGTTDN